ncbi:hypothetical protein PVA45_02685 [Entomospira entomophila]|uniref:DUF4878 domain-containing protein n=1 Tax=Entomospira entomophila TaxID=2719988 RepID=A0A968G9R3_9SPIO|nr:hypothetical protein [Entomospira entomophilus]NIZ40420.1 hypothetical protein [Entomospira entomophilus]WDI35978.1 hypothetical protein PVA45_02685 [Entomospira entomophilus]
MHKKFYMLSVLFVLVGIFSSCRGVVGLIDTPEGVANKFLVDLYHLSFESIPSFATDQALMQAALMEGYADSFSKEERARHLHSEVMVKEVVIQDETKAQAEYTITFGDGQVIQNRLILEKRDRQWWVIAFHKPIMTPMIYQYLTT